MGCNYGTFHQIVGDEYVACTITAALFKAEKLAQIGARMIFLYLLVLTRLSTTPDAWLSSASTSSWIRDSIFFCLWCGCETLTFQPKSLEDGKLEVRA